MNDQIISTKKYDLEERTAVFAEHMIEQLVGSGGSMGANYYEANEAESKKDFIHKVGICKKETKHWLRLLARANPEFAEEFRILWKECQELLLIFSAIVTKAKLSAG